MPQGVPFVRPNGPARSGKVLWDIARAEYAPKATRYASTLYDVVIKYRVRPTLPPAQQRSPNDAHLANIIMINSPPPPPPPFRPRLCSASTQPIRPSRTTFARCWRNCMIGTCLASASWRGRCNDADGSRMQRWPPGGMR